MLSVLEARIPLHRTKKSDTSPDDGSDIADNKAPLPFQLQMFFFFFFFFFFFLLFFFFFLQFYKMFNCICLSFCFDVENLM